MVANDDSVDSVQALRTWSETANYKFLAGCRPGESESVLIFQSTVPKSVLVIRDEVAA